VSARFSSRRAFRAATSIGQIGRDLRPTARQLVQRRKQQPQGAELVTEVGIELGPGPVQFGQPLQPSALAMTALRLGQAVSVCAATSRRKSR
jgi:hypothetical protein